MKRFLLSIVFLLAMTQVWGNRVALQTARLAAERFALSQSISVEQNPVVSVAPEGLFAQMYVFGFGGAKGFVVIAADDRVIPILGYSLTNDFSPTDMPEHISEWFADYEDQIGWLIDHNVEPTAEVQRQWAELTNPEIDAAPAMIAAVGPLMTTTWNQYPYYNNSCPMDGSTRSKAGCVATATAQIMKYWNHPTTGHGSHSYTWKSQTLSANFANTTYQWSSMPNALSSSSTTAQNNAVATLIYHLGVALEMNYGASGSSSNTYTTKGTDPSAETVLQTYFKYQNTIRNVMYSDMTDAQWKATLKSELNSNRVVLYAGRDASAGHSFVCDGYNNSDYFHFNWGWGGTYDGYFAIGALNPGSGGAGSNVTNTFNLRNAAVIGIQPMTGSLPATTTVAATAANNAHGSVTGTGTYNQYDTIQLVATANEGYIFDHWDDNDRTNPRYAFATSSSFNRTAYFEPLPTDTMRYCDDYFSAAFSFSQQWGIRYDESAIKGERLLTKVMVNLYETSQYNLVIYQGDGSRMTQVYSQQFTPTTSREWYTIQLTTPYVIDTTRSLWITLSYTGSGGYPMAYSDFYGGNNDGMMVNYQGTWTSFNNGGVKYGSWLIKGITEEIAPPIEVVCDQIFRAGYESVSSYSGYRILLYSNNYAVNFTIDCDASVQDINDGQTYTLSDMDSFYSYVANLNALLSIPRLKSASVVRSNGCYEAYVTDVNDIRYHFTYSNVTAVTPVTLPYVCDFESGQDSLFWDLGDNGNANAFTIGSGTNNGGSKSLYISNDGSSYNYSPLSESSSISYIPSGIKAFARVLVPLTPGDYVVSYDYKCTGFANSFNVDYGRIFFYPAFYASGCVHSPDMQEPVNNIDISPSTAICNVTSWTHAEYRVTITDSANYFFQVNWRNSRSISSIYGMAIDNVRIEEYRDTFSVTANVNDAAMGSVAGGGDYLDGDTATLTATPSANYHFVNWSNGATTPTINVVVTKDTTFTANFAIDTHNVTVNVNDAAMGSVVGGGTFNHGATATLTATPSANHHFVSWSNGATTPTINIVVTKDTTLTATFAIDTHNVTVNVNDAAMGSVTGGGTYNYGATATLTATANSGYHFVSWSNGATTPTINIVVTKDTTLTATFAIDTHNVTVNVNDAAMGSVVGGGTYNYGTTATLTATANAGYHFVSWSNGATTATLNVVVTRDTSFTANFAINQSYLFETTETICQGDAYQWRSVYYSASGEYYDSLTSVYGEDSVYKLTLTVNPTYYIQESQIFSGEPIIWHGKTITTVGVYYDSLVTAMGCDSIYELTVTWREYTVTVNVNDQTMGSVTGGGTYYEGDVATLTATPNAGYEFDGWSNGEKSQTIRIVVVSDTVLTANFGIKAGVEDVSEVEYVVYSEQGRIVVCGAMGKKVSVYDVSGRLVAETVDANETHRFVVDMAGVYVVCVDERNAVKVIVE